MKRILGNHMQTFATVLLTGITLLLSQAAWAEIAAPAMTNNTARIRLFGQNQRPSLAYVGIDCNTNPKGTRIDAGGGLGEAFKSFIRVAQNTRLGMADTEASVNIKQRNGILSKAFYKEVVIPAGLPLNAQAYFVGLNNVSSSTSHRYILSEKSTSSKGVSFIPEAGHDYEILSIRNQGKEYLVVTDITTPDFIPVVVNEPFSCKK